LPGLMQRKGRLEGGEGRGLNWAGANVGTGHRRLG